MKQEIPFHELVIKTVAREFHVSEEDILNGVMKHRVCDARYVIMDILIVKDQKHKQKEIAEILNIRQNSPYNLFHHGRKKVNSLLKTDREFKLRFELCMHLIKNHNL